MIDTDKYDGEGKWILGEYKGRPCITVHEDAETPRWVRYVARNVNPKYQALLLDAPLLLAEVKRLREENNRYLDFILWLGIEHKGKKLAWEYGDEELAEMIE